MSSRIPIFTIQDARRFISSYRAEIANEYLDTRKECDLGDPGACDEERIMKAVLDEFDTFRRAFCRNVAERYEIQAAQNAASDEIPF